MRASALEALGPGGLSGAGPVFRLVCVVGALASCRGPPALFGVPLPAVQAFV